MNQHISHRVSDALLPSAMEQKLAQISRRQAAICVLRSVAIGASVLIAAMVAAMLIDWQWTLFDTGIRAALTITAVLSAAAALLATGVRPLLSALKRLRAATDADSEIPQLEERWQTVVTMSASNGRLTSPMATAMLRQVTSEAVAIGRIVQPGQVARPEALLPSVKALTACALLLAGFLALDWQSTSVLLRRFWSPLSEISATQLHSETGDVIVPRGESIDLVAELSGLPRSSATLQIARPDAVHEDLKVAVQPDRPSAFVQRLEVEDSFQYRIRAGDGQTSWHTVTAVDYPVLADVRFTVVPPAYLKRPNYEKHVLPGRVKVMQGSILQLQMRPKSNLDRLDLVLAFDAEEQGNEAATRQVQSLAVDEDGWYRFETTVMGAFSLSPQLWNSHGLTDEDRSECRIQVIVDQAPVARVVGPSDELAVAADDVVDIKFEAHDDHGIATAELVIYDESSADDGQPAQILKVVPIPLDDQLNEKHVMGTTQLDLKELGLETGKQISYAVRVTDNRTMAPGPTATSKQEADGDPSESPSNDSTTEMADAAETPGESPDSSPPQSLQTGREPAAADSAEQPLAATDPDGDAPNADEIGVKSEPGSKSEVVAKSTKPDKPVPQSDDPAHAGDAPNPEPVPADVQTASTKSENAVADATRPDNQVAKLENDSTATLNDAPADPESNLSEIPDADRDAVGQLAQAEEANDKPVPDDGQSDRRQANSATEADAPPNARLAMAPQRSEAGQNAETNRRRLKITERLSALAAATAKQQELTGIRDRVVAIDKLLAEVETGLSRIVEREIPDDERTAQFQFLDAGLGNIETRISDLHHETRGEQFAFVGLQMLDIGRSHVTPARERVFAAIRETPTAADGNARGAYQQVIRARELLAALLTRYDRAARDQKLAQALDEAVKMYEVYVEKSQQLMREARQNRNPLERKMAVLEIGQDYLDRYAEVLTLRREMLSEFGRFLSDDPRLLARYLDLVKRRRDSLRDQLSELAERQSEAASELANWTHADPAQQEDFWTLLIELRMQTSTPLAKDGAELAERIEKQLPLVLEARGSTPGRVVELGRQIAEVSRFMSLDARRQIRQPGSVPDLPQKAAQLVLLFAELDATLEQLNFENSQEQEVTAYVTSRLLESRAVAAQADAWLQVTEHAQQKRFHGLAEVDQHRLALDTEFLRVDMQGIDAALESQYQQVAMTSLPEEITTLIRELHQLMDEIVFLQGSATFAMTQNRLQSAEAIQTRINAAFAQAEELFDRIRRDVAAALDEFDVRNPEVADLQDPTLDAFLAQLEREPNIEAQLGLPDRPRNLRVIAETMDWQTTGGDLLADSEAEAMLRVKQAMRLQKPEKKSAADKPEETEPKETQMTEEEEQQRREQAEELEKNIARALASMKERIEDPATPAKERQELEQRTRAMQEFLDQMKQNPLPPDEWSQIAKSDQMQAILKALARGDDLPDEQWNKLVSTLGDGLWQVGGRTLPEDYRKSIEQYQERIRRLLNTTDPEE